MTEDTTTEKKADLFSFKTPFPVYGKRKPWDVPRYRNAKKIPRVNSLTCATNGGEIFHVPTIIRMGGRDTLVEDLLLHKHKSTNFQKDIIEKNYKLQPTDYLFFKPRKLHEPKLPIWNRLENILFTLHPQVHDCADGKIYPFKGITTYTTKETTKYAPNVLWVDVTELKLFVLNLKKEIHGCYAQAHELQV